MRFETSYFGWRAGLAAVVILFAGMNGLAASVEPVKAAVCSAPEYHQFDFWVGDWDAFDVGGPAARSAVTRVDRILDGCVLLENYHGVDGLSGQSFTIYDSTRKVWHQSWVTSLGNLLVIEGKLENGAIVLSGVDRTPSGQERLVRGTWKPEAEGVRESAVRSTDGGKTWVPWFDIIFRPHKP